MFHQCMRERNLSNVTFVTTAVLKKSIWKQMFHWFMWERSHLNVTSVTTAVLSKTIWLSFLHQFMRERNLSNVTFVTRTFLKSNIWRIILQQFTREKNNLAGRRVHKIYWYLLTEDLIYKNMSLVMNVNKFEFNEKYAYLWIGFIRAALCVSYSPGNRKLKNGQEPRRTDSLGSPWYPYLGAFDL